MNQQAYLEWGARRSKVSEIRFELITSRSTPKRGGGRWFESNPRYLINRPKGRFLLRVTGLGLITSRSTPKRGGGRWFESNPRY